MWGQKLDGGLEWESHDINAIQFLELFKGLGRGFNWKGFQPSGSSSVHFRRAEKAIVMTPTYGFSQTVFITCLYCTSSCTHTPHHAKIYYYSLPELQPFWTGEGPHEWLFLVLPAFTELKWLFQLFIIVLWFPFIPFVLWAKSINNSALVLTLICQQHLPE